VYVSAVSENLRWPTKRGSPPTSARAGGLGTVLPLLPFWLAYSDENGSLMEARSARTRTAPSPRQERAAIVIERRVLVLGEARDEVQGEGVYGVALVAGQLSQVGDEGSRETPDRATGGHRASP
jgi:hypothetical protein